MLGSWKKTGPSLCLCLSLSLSLLSLFHSASRQLTLEAGTERVGDVYWAPFQHVIKHHTETERDKRERLTLSELRPFIISMQTFK